MSMRIRLLVSRATLDGPQSIGDELDVADAEAIRLFAAGHAEPVRQQAPEQAVPRIRAEKAVRR